MKRVLILVLISFLLSIFWIMIIGRKFEKTIINYANVEAERIASIITNKAAEINEEELNDLFEIKKDEKDNIQIININSKKTNKILKKIKENAINHLDKIEKGQDKEIIHSDSLSGSKYTYLKNGIVCDIPLGILFNNAILINLTPSIPIKFSFIGTVESKIKTKVKEYGFNNALIEIEAEVIIKEKITMPLSSKTTQIKTTIPLLTQVVQGTVPYYYNSNY